MQNKRKLKRVHLIYYLRLFDNQTNDQVGHLVDITTEGIMMISAGNITGRDEIEFQARSLWCRKDFNPDFYVAGFKIEKISAKELKTITALINQYGFKS
jgi:hypothetical protein